MKNYAVNVRALATTLEQGAAIAGDRGVGMSQAAGAIVDWAVGQGRLTAMEMIEDYNEVEDADEKASVRRRILQEAMRVDDKSSGRANDLHRAFHDGFVREVEDARLI